MLISSALISSAPNISNFYNLALLICQLLIDGNFRNAQILYDPQIFDGRLMDDFGSVCSSSFPWRTMDITQALPSHYNQDEHTRNDLQLIFLDPNHSADTIDQFKELFTFYSIFVLASTNELDAKVQNLGQTFNITTLYYNMETGSVIIGDDFTEKSDPKVHKDQVNSFNWTFGRKEQMKSIVVRVGGWFRDDVQSTDLESNPRRRFFTNYYLQMLNTRFIHVTFQNAANPKSPPKNQLFVVQQRKLYKELSDTIHEVNGDENS